MTEPAPHVSARTGRRRTYLRRRPWSFDGILLAVLAILLVIALAQQVAYPLHQAGIAQPFLTPVMAVAFLADLPGAVFVRIALGREALHDGALGAIVRAAVTGTFYFLLLTLLAGGFAERRRRRARRHAEGVDPVDLPRRNLLLASGRAALAAGAVATPAGAAGWALFYEPTALRVRRFNVRLTGLPPELDGLTVLHATDFHHGKWVTREQVESVARQMNTLAPDLIVLTGDYVLNSPRYILPAAQALAGLTAPLGVFATLGNHDWWEDADAMRRELQNAGFTMLDNELRLITPARTVTPFDAAAPAGLALGGLGDLWEDTMDYRGIIGGVPAHLPLLLLAHNPDTAEESGFRAEAAARRVDLMLCGHTHGGQVRLPGIGTPIVPSRYGQRYAHGWKQLPGARLYVSSGVGMSGLPIRFGVPPEIVVFTLRSA